jgi:hypothetical protein
MPTEADTQAAENKLEDWLNQADTIIREAKPASGYFYILKI